MKKQYFRYKYFDTVIVRTPLFPLEALLKQEEYSASTAFLEAIFIASPEFMRLKKSHLQNDDKSIVDKAEITVHKYFTRSSTRCTPFGLFAGCSMAPISENEQGIVLSPIDKYCRCTRLDMQYLCALIRHLENNPEIRSLLRFYPNDSIYSIAGQLRYVEYHYKNTRRTHQIASIEQNEYIATILEAAKKGLKPLELARLIMDDDIDIGDALGFINEVIDNQVLKSELDPAVVGEDVLSVLISKLQQIGENDIVNKLIEIKVMLTDIDNMPLGDSRNMYDDIVEVVKSIGVGYEDKFLFQTDMYKPIELGGISKDVVEEVNECLTFLSRINDTYQNNNIQTFKQDFLERYEYEEVPLAMVLDGEIGIGYPSKNGGNDINFLVDDLILPVRQSAAIHIPASPVDLVLLKKYVKAIKNGDNVIYIEDRDFPVKNQYPEVAYPNTCSAMCSIMKNKENKAMIYLKSAGQGGANLLGRFCHINTNIAELVKATADFESYCEPESVIVEISHLPESRIGNISSRPVFRDGTLHYLSNTDSTVRQSLDISDLMLSIKNDRLFLRSKQLNKEIIPRLTCAHNFSMTPIPIYRFLCDMQSQDISVSFFLRWGEVFKIFDYVPRIQYKNIILSRQRWTISHDEIKDSNKLSDVELLLFFKNIIHKHNLVSHVVIPEGDNEIYIDLTDIKCLKLLLDIVKNKTSFDLYEYLFSEYDSVVLSRQSDHYVNEVIIIFHK
jgi:hypothetical protein